MQFSMWGEVLVTYNDEDAYLFGHPATTGQRKPTVQAQHRYSVDSHDGRRRRRRMRVDTSDEDIADACAEDAPIACFRGQRNSQTIKGISFLGCVMTSTVHITCFSPHAHCINGQ